MPRGAISHARFARSEAAGRWSGLGRLGTRTADFLGHSDAHSTRRYARRSDEALVSVLRPRDAASDEDLSLAWLVSKRSHCQIRCPGSAGLERSYQRAGPVNARDEF